jgi:hypothetical protein
LLELNICDARGVRSSRGFGDRRFGYVDRSDSGFGAIQGEGQRLRADTTSRFENTASNWI